MNKNLQKGANPCKSNRKNIIVNILKSVDCAINCLTVYTNCTNRTTLLTRRTDRPTWQKTDN